MTELEWQELNRQYRDVFGEDIPRSMLPANEDMAAKMVREAIQSRDDGRFECGLPEDAVI